jgi:hypothetical protein
MGLKKSKLDRSKTPVYTANSEGKVINEKKNGIIRGSHPCQRLFM